MYYSSTQPLWKCPRTRKFERTIGLLNAHNHTILNVFRSENCESKMGRCVLNSGRRCAYGFEWPTLMECTIWNFAKYDFAELCKFVFVLFSSIIRPTRHDFLLWSLLAAFSRFNIYAFLTKNNKIKAERYFAQSRFRRRLRHHHRHCSHFAINFTRTVVQWQNVILFFVYERTCALCYFSIT